jgi:hypothetical protein
MGPKWKPDTKKDCPTVRGRKLTSTSIFQFTEVQLSLKIIKNGTSYSICFQFNISNESQVTGWRKHNLYGVHFEVDIMTEHRPFHKQCGE